MNLPPHLRSSVSLVRLLPSGTVKRMRYSMASRHLVLTYTNGKKNRTREIVCPLPK